MIRNTVLALLVVGLLLGTGVATANHSSYYNNSSGVVQPNAPRNANLSNIVGLAIQLSPDLIGTGEQDPSGTGFQGVLLTGLVFAGVSLGTIVGIGVGSVAGTILGTVVAYGLVDLGYAPPWIKPVLLFAIGVLTFIMFKRVFR